MIQATLDRERNGYLGVERPDDIKHRWIAVWIVVDSKGSCQEMQCEHPTSILDATHALKGFFSGSSARRAILLSFDWRRSLSA
jgi:hypothetical protein